MTTAGSGAATGAMRSTTTTSCGRAACDPPRGRRGFPPWCTLGAMPQVVELPPIGQDARGALVALVRVCKEMPAQGEPFRELRSRLRAAKLWDRERPQVLLRFVGMGGANPSPSLFMQALAAANGDDETALAILDRVWQLNPLLGKTVIDL